MVWKKAIEEQVRKMKLTYHLKKDTYNKKVLSCRPKLRHLDTIIKPECFIATKIPNMIGKGGLEDTEKREKRKFSGRFWLQKKGEEIRL